MQIILATHNRGKMEEMSAILGHLPVELLALDAFPEIGDIPETGNTLKENAFIKAETVHRLTGLPALADDTGLEVDALNGAPGIYSARYAGADATFDDNYQKILKELHGIPVEKRTARFRTVIAFVNGGEKEWVEGVAEGRI
nr:non-canonical purine NTP pyrophosphatase [Candidatus Neomarinimicrobiota bacterium]